MNDVSMELERRVEVLESRIDELEEMVGGSEVMTTESDMETFLDRVSPGTHVERATVIGFHLVHEQQTAPFTVADIEEAYEECRIRKPANLSDVLSGAEERGWLMRSGTKGQNQLWTITRDGDAAVESGFEQ